MISSPDELDLNKLVREDRKLFFEIIVRAVFRNPHPSFHKNVVWKEFWSNLSEDQKLKAEKVCHFYYYMCLPYKESWDMPDAKRLVFTASIMETLMGEEHIDFYRFLCLEKLDNITQVDLERLENDYREKYGSSKKFRGYFEKYFLEEDLRYLRHSIKKQKSGVFVQLETNKELADFFYDLRSQVVHNANLLTISNEIIGSFDFELKEKKYKLDINIYEYLRSFEKSLVNYFSIS